MRDNVLLSSWFCVCWVEESLIPKEGLNLRKTGERKVKQKRENENTEEEKEIVEENGVGIGK